MSLKINQMPDTDIVPQESTVPVGKATPPAKKKRTRRTKKQIEAEKAAAQQQEKNDVQKSIQLQEGKTHQNGASVVSSQSSDVPPWEESSTHEAAIAPWNQPENKDSVGCAGPGTVSPSQDSSVNSQQNKERDIYKLGVVGGEWNIGGKVHKLVHSDFDFKIFKVVHDVDK